MKDINTVIHQPTRLRIMASLVGLDPDMRVDFNHLRDELSLSEGNLSVHLRKLEEAGLILLEKEFVNRIPRTWARLSKQGRTEFVKYVSALEDILRTGK